MSDRVETARAFYRAAREELVKRLGLRDGVLLVFLGFTGGLFGLAFGTTGDMKVLLVVPYLALGCSILVSQHNAVIGALIHYVNNDLQKDINDSNPPVSEFVSSQTFRDHSKNSNRWRTVGHFVLLGLPSGFAIYINWDLLHSGYPIDVGLVFSIVTAAIGAVFILISHFQRQTIYNQTKWN